MSRSDVDRLTWYILGLGAAFVCTIFLLSGAVAALSTAAGVAVALANWFLLRYIVGRVFDANVRRQAAFAFVLIAKLGALMAVVFFLLRTHLVLPIPFTVGVSSLALGALLGSFAHILHPSAVEGER